MLLAAGAILAVDRGATGGEQGGRPRPADASATSTPAAPPLRETVRRVLPPGYASAGRTYLLHTGGIEATPRPLVLVLPGLHHSADSYEAATGASAHSDSHGYDVAYPVSAEGRWNAGACCLGATSDDVQFLRDVVADAATRAPVDRARVQVWGFSNGAMMAFRAVCDAPEVFAAAGVMSGALVTPCASTRVVVHHLHGALDTVVPYAGGVSQLVGPVPDSAREAELVGPGSTITIQLLPCKHVWATVANGCGLDATDRFWQALSTAGR